MSPFSSPVGDAGLLRLITGGVSVDADRVLREGGILVADPRYLLDGRVTVLVSEYDEQGGTEARPVTSLSLPAASIGDAKLAPHAGFYSDGAARALGLAPQPTHLLYALDRTATEDEQEALTADITQLTGEEFSLTVERGYVDNFAPGLLALALGSALVTLGAAGIATGLAQADARPDHASLAAIGASPRVRRLLAAWQAFLIAGLGTALGVAAGLVPALSYLRADTRMDVVVPWPSLLGIVVAVPVIAALGAGLCVRSRLPLRRRLA